jgi:hypothetical protein
MANQCCCGRYKPLSERFIVNDYMHEPFGEPGAFCGTVISHELADLRIENKLQAERIEELEKELAAVNRSENYANQQCMEAVGVTHEQKDQLEALTRLALPSVLLTPTPDGSVLLSRGDQWPTATISRIAARAAIRSLHFVIPEWLWSEKDPEGRPS